jgi:hypothetical protein
VAKHLSLWKPFARIHLIMKDAAVISTERVEELKRICPAFVELFCSVFPGQAQVAQTAPSWVPRRRVGGAHGSIGLFAADAAESMHALLMRLERRFAQTKGLRRHELMMNGLFEKQNTGLRAMTPNF